MLLSIVYLLLFIMFIFCFIYKILRKKNNKDNLILFIIVLIIYLYNLFINLTCATIHTLGVTRYVADQFVIIILSEFLTIAIFLKMINLNFIKNHLKAYANKKKLMKDKKNENINT